MLVFFLSFLFCFVNGITTVKMTDTGIAAECNIGISADNNKNWYFSDNKKPTGISGEKTKTCILTDNKKRRAFKLTIRKTGISGGKNKDSGISGGNS